MNKLNKFMEALAVDAKLQREFQQSPGTAALGFGLNEQELQAVTDRDQSLIQGLSKEKSDYRAYIFIQLPISPDDQHV